MTIRKISGRTSSLAVKATVTQGGIFKAALQKPSNIKAAALERLQSFPQENWDLSLSDVDYDLDSSIILPWGSELDTSVTQEINAFIPKIANVTARVIDHLLYDPDGFGIRHFYDSLLLGEAVGRGITKTLADNFDLADSLLINYALGRNPADVQNTDDLIGLLLRTRRTFDDATAPTSRPYLWFAPKPLSDVQTFADLFFIARVKNFEDNLTSTDAFNRLAQSYRTFADDVGMLDAFTFIDGSTFELRRRLSDTVSVNTTNLEVLRNTGNETENFSYFIDKVLDPDMELLDQLAKLGLKSLTSVDITAADRPFLYTAKTAADTATTADAAPVFLGIKRFTDTETLDSLINFSVSKLLADTTTMLDSLAFGDQLAYDTTKLIADEIGSTDRPFLFYAPRALEDSLTPADTNRSRFIKASTDLVDLAESNTKLFAKTTNNILSLADILNIARLRDYADVFTPADLESFALTKVFADAVTADDPLVRLTDGNITLLIKQRQDTEPIDDYFARAVNYYRYPHHEGGRLGDFVPALEKDSKFVNLRARAGALTTYPIIRTNLISWSEQFDTNQSGGYWTSIGATVITNATPAPQNVVSSNSTTYDADQLQELFYNKPNNNYARSWYQLTPGRWVISSDGDLLKQDTSNGTHQLSTPNIPELIGTTNFGFSIHLKYAGHRYVRLWVTSFVNVDVDMVNNVVVATSAGKASMQPVGGGWFLVQMENRIVNFGIAPEMQILNEILYNSTNSPYGTYQYKLVPDNIISSARIVLLDNNLNTTFTGNGTDGVYVWGAQLEVGDQPEQEISSLKYIRTAGGSATRIGFSVTPTDNDRVFVGRIQRRGGQEVRNDPFEVISLLLQYRVPVASHLATPTDYFARSVRYFRDRVTEPGLGDSFAAGNGNSLRRYSNDPLELISFWFNKDAKKAGTSTATRQTVVRQNLLKWSERFDYDYWTKSNVLATTGISVIGGSLPYRNVVYDADQIHGLFYNKKYTYNQGRRWWDVIPLSTASRPDFTSNTIVDIFESSSNSIHTVQTFGFATNLSGDFFASSIYASPANGVTRFRLQVGSVFADFDLSSIAVLSSVGTLYNKIVQADTSTGWYLCTIIGPTQALGTLNFTGDAVIPTDLLQKLLPRTLAPDSFTVADTRPAFFGNKFLADTTTMLSNFFIGDGSTYTSNKQLLDSFVAGTAEGFRTSGNQLENVSFVDKFVAHRSGEVTATTIKLFANTILQADQVVDVFPNRTNKTWYQLAPYYSHSAHINDYPTDYERVRVGSQTGGRKQSGNPYETIAFLISRPVLDRNVVQIGGSSYITTVLSQNLFLTSGNPETNTSYPGYGNYWSKSGTNTRIATNITSAPIAAATSAWGIVATSPVNSTKNIYAYPFNDLVENTQYTFSVYITFNFTTKTEHVFRIDKGGDFVTWYVLNNGTIPSYIGNPGALDSYSMETVGGGWYRMIITFTTANSPGYTGEYINFLPGGNGQTPYGTSDTVVFFGPQIQLGSIATPYQRTTSTSITSNTASVASTTAFRLQPSQSSSENTTFFIRKQIDETKLIPTIPKYDAAAVAGLFYNTTRNIDGRRYTPQDGNYTYYARTDWYSLAPRYARPRFAYGTGNTPGTIMIDNMALGDDLTYISQFNLRTTVLIGSPDGIRGTSDRENFSFNLNLRPRRGAFTDLYIAKARPTKFDADQTAGIFYASSNSTTSYTKLNPYGRRWYQLAPYYASYEHFKNSPGEYDFVRVGSVRGPLRHLGWPTEIMSLGILKTPYETSAAIDVRTNWIGLTAKISTTSDYTGYYLNRINLISSSENLFNSSWTKSAVSISTSTVIQSGALPFRNISLDANQVNENFYNTKSNNNYGTRWYQLAPSLRNRPNYTSTLVNIVSESSSNTQHYLETQVTKPATADAWWAFSVYVRVQNAADRFRLGVDGQTADFRLSTASITASSNNIYARIRNLDSSTGTYLVNILGAGNSTSFAARIQLLNSAGNTSYAGNTSTGLYVWGAQFEVSEYYNELRNDVDNFRYLRSQGETSYRLAVRFGPDSRTDYILAGQAEDARMGGSSLENVSFKTLLRARRSGDATSILITLGSITRTSADQTAEVFDNIRTSTPIINRWYQLAPYYRSSLYNRPTDYDLVRVGSQTTSKRTSSDPYETLSFWYAPRTLVDSSTVQTTNTRRFVRKEFSETRMIPNNPRFDAARVAGLELYSTSSQNINLGAYTPLSGGTQYYRARDWYSEAPLSNRARFSVGNAGVGPVMIDNFLFGDVFTYTGSKLLSSVAVTVGTQLTSVNLTYLLPTFSLSSVLVTSLSQNLITNSESLSNWSVAGSMIVIPANTAAPDGGSAVTITSTVPGLVNRISQPLVRPVTSGNFISVSAYVKWNSITSGDLIRFGVAINSSNVTHGVQFNVVNGVNPTTSTVTYYISQADAVVPWYRIQFYVTAPTRLTVDNTRIVFEHTSGSSINFAAWGVQIAEALVAPTYRRTTSTVVDAQSIYSYTQISTAVSSTNIGTKYGNDPNETIDVRLNKSAKQSTFTDLYVRNRQLSPFDADQTLGLFYNTSNNTLAKLRTNPYGRRWYQLAPYYNSFGHVKQSPQDTDRVLLTYKEITQRWLDKSRSGDAVSTTGDAGFRKQTGQNSLETTRFDVQLFARKSTLTTSNVVITNKANWVTYSEDFTNFYWNKTAAGVVQAPQLMSGRYPYRNTNFDAAAVANQFLIVGTSSSYTRYNNYYKRAWYALAPLTNRPAFSSTVLQYVSDQDVADAQHEITADVQLPGYSIAEEYVTFSLHVQRQSAVNKFRMDVGRCWADFDLSSVSVISSNINVLWANIRYVDTSAGVFLCQVIAPIKTYPNTLIRLAVTSDTITAGDSGLGFLLRDRRTFDDAVVGTESINNDKITDYHI